MKMRLKFPFLNSGLVNNKNISSELNDGAPEKPFLNAGLVN